MKPVRIFLGIAVLLFVVSCITMRDVVQKKYGSLDNFKYVYITSNRCFADTFHVPDDFIGTIAGGYSIIDSVTGSVNGIGIGRFIDEYKPASSAYPGTSRMYDETFSPLFAGNPKGVIIEYMEKKGYDVVDKITETDKENTLIINYGYLGRRDISLVAYTAIMTIQFLSASDSTLLCSTFAEGVGDSEIEDVKIALKRGMEKALDGVFPYDGPISEDEQFQNMMKFF